MNPKLLFLTLVAVFLILIPEEAEATNDGDLVYSANISMENGTGRQPNLNYPTMIIARDQIDFPLSAVNQEGMIEWQTSPDNSTWTTRSWNHKQGNVAGLGFSQQSETGIGHNFIVEKGEYYRFLIITVAGTPTYTIHSIYEIEMDVFEYDPLSDISCSQLAKPSEVVFCGFTAYYQNQTTRNDLGYNVTVQNQTLTTIINTTAINTGSLGKYRFNFTSESTPQTYEITVYNTSLSYAKSFWVKTEYVGLTTEQNTTLHNITFNDTGIRTAINQSEERIKQNVTAEHVITRALISGINTSIIFEVSQIVGDIFGYIMSNGDTYQEFIEGMDENITNTNSTLHNAIDNISVNATINLTAEEIGEAVCDTIVWQHPTKGNITLCHEVNETYKWRAFANTEN